MPKRSKTRKPNGNRAVGYIRVSDPTQIEDHSLDAQREEISRWCRRKGYELVHVYAEEGKSARSERIDKRPQLKALLDDARAGRFDVVVVHMIDRWARNLGVQRQALQMLGDSGLGFASVTEDFDFTTPSGKLLLTMIGGCAEFFSDQLAVHVAKSRKHRASMGLPVGPVPFGYRTADPKAPAVIEHREAETVTEIFGRRARGESTGSLANWLNSQGFKTRKGGIFTPHAIKDMLNCRFYLGKVRYGEEEYSGQHEAIITESLYEQVQARKLKRAVVRTVVGPKGLLQGMISCGNCGKGLQSDKHKLGKAMYRERHSRECSTNPSSTVADGIDKQVEEILKSVQLKPDWRQRMARLAIASRKGPDPSELQKRRRAISVIFECGGMSELEYRAKMAKVDELMVLTRDVETPTLEEAGQLFDNIEELWEEATPEERRKLISPLIERVCVDLESKMIGAIVPSPAFRRLLDDAMKKAETSAVILLSDDETERQNVWSWWRRGRVELPVQKTLRLGYATGLSGMKISLPQPPTSEEPEEASRLVFSHRYRRHSDCTSTLCRPFAPFEER